MAAPDWRLRRCTKYCKNRTAVRRREINFRKRAPNLQGAKSLARPSGAWYIIKYSFRAERPEGIPAMFCGCSAWAGKMAQIEDTISEF